MTEGATQVGAFVLAKNEAENISRCLSALAQSGWDVHVLDSGSTDGTQQIVSGLPNVSLHPYTYVDHCTSYNDVIARFTNRYRVVLILDADMVISDALRRELDSTLEAAGTEWDALRAPVEMWIEGHRLKSGSLYPPKPIAFVTGRPLFKSVGHAEQLLDDARVRELKNVLRHDDRKDYSSFLASQARYAGQLVDRYRNGQVSWRDKVRVRTPLLAVVVPVVSFIAKRGFAAGRAGFLYALDRLIAEAIMYRYGLAMRVIDKSRRRP